MGTVVSLLIAVSFIATGVAKLFFAKSQVEMALPWVRRVPQPALRLLGGLQIVGGLGVLADRVLPVSVVPDHMATGAAYAISALGIMMAGAVLSHLVVGDPVWFSFPALGLLMFLVLLEIGF